MKLSKKARTLAILTILFYIFGMPISNILFALGSQQILDFALQGDLSGVLIILFSVIVLVLLSFLCIISADRYRAHFIKEVLETVKNHRLSLILSRASKIPAVDETKELSFFTVDIEILKNSYYLNILRLPLYTFWVVSVLVVMLWINWLVAIVAVVISLPPLMLSKVFGGELAKPKKNYSDEAASYVDSVKEYLDGKGHFSL